MAQQQTNFPQYYGYVDPRTDEMERLRKELQQPVPSRFTPEQAAERQATNQREYELGVLGMLSGDKMFGNVGGQVFKQALAGRTPKVTEQGEYDPLTGAYSYHPEVLRQRKEAELGRLEAASAAGQERRQEAYLRGQEAFENRKALASIAASNRGSNEPVVIVMDPTTGQPTYMRRSEAVGKAAPAKGGAASEGERNASGYALRMTEATKLLDQYEPTGRSSYSTDVAGSVPWVGGAARRATMSVDQQKYRQAQEDWVRAKLRKESGASIASDEMQREIETYFPQPGETDPGLLAQKHQSREIANQAMILSAGRGYQGSQPTNPDAPTAPGGTNPDPLGLRRK